MPTERDYPPTRLSEGRVRRRPLAVLALIVLVMALTLPVLSYPLGRDQGEFAIIGREVLAGSAPYVDLWNPKPPAVFYVYSAAMAVLGYTTTALRSLDLLMFPPLGLGLFWLGRRLANRRVGLMAVAIFAAVYFRQSFWTLTQNDGLVILPMVLAVVCAFRALDAVDDGPARSGLWAALCGAWCAVTLWFKYPFVFFVLALVVGHALSRREQAGVDWRLRLWRDALAFALGGGIVGVGGIAYLASLGAFEAWIESAFVTSGYTRQGFDDIFTSPIWRDSLRNWLTLPVVSILIGWPLLRLLARCRPTGWHVVWLWWLGALAALLAQAKGYDYHYLPMVASLALLAADAIDRAATGLVRRWPSAIGDRALRLWLPAAVLSLSLQLLLIDVWTPALPYLTGAEDRLTYYERFQSGEFVASESLAVSDYLRQRTTAGDSLYIWGFRSEVYYLADLRPPTRFIFQYPLVGAWYPPEWREENVAILWAALPPYVLVVQGDFMPWVTGIDADSKMLLEERYIDLLHWLQYNYEEETQIGSFIVWRRTSRE